MKPCPRMGRRRSGDDLGPAALQLLPPPVRPDPPRAGVGREPLHPPRPARPANRGRAPAGETAYGVPHRRGLPCGRIGSGLIGKADVVEFHGDACRCRSSTSTASGGKPAHDELQLAAQAVCLEEMFGVTVARGVIFHHTSRRRREVVICPALRSDVEEAVRPSAPCSARGVCRTPSTIPAATSARCASRACPARHGRQGPRRERPGPCSCSAPPGRSPLTPAREVRTCTNS